MSTRQKSEGGIDCLPIGRKAGKKVLRTGESLGKEGLRFLHSDPHTPSSPMHVLSDPAHFSAPHFPSASQETVIQGMKTLTSSVPTVPLVSTMIRMTPAAANRAPVTMGSAVL